MWWELHDKLTMLVCHVAAKPHGIHKMHTKKDTRGIDYYCGAWPCISYIHYASRSFSVPGMAWARSCRFIVVMLAASRKRIIMMLKNTIVKHNGQKFPASVYIVGLPKQRHM